jgi:1,4-dihydroxy-2-naphthoyl-CoA hydrolase
MAIWHESISIEEASRNSKGTMMEACGIEITEVGDDWVKGRMPVDARTRQIYGILHGGASCVLAETLGSMASGMVVDSSKYRIAGLEINANHVRSVSEGWVEGIARPLHLGRTTHIWDIRISNAEGKLVCISRLTTAVLARA